MRLNIMPSGLEVSQATRPPRAPARHHVGAVSGDSVEAIHQRGDHMATVWMEVVARSIGIAGHGGDVVTAMLPAIRLAQLDAGDPGHRIPLIGGSSGPVSKAFSEISSGVSRG